MSEVPAFYSIGFFGAPNIGDELLCKAVADSLQRNWPECTHFVVTVDRAVSQAYTKTGSTFVEGFAPQPEYLANFTDHWTALRSSDLVIVGGGGLIADRYSWAGLTRYAADASLGLLLGRNFILAGVGALRIRRRWLLPLARFLCREAAVALCRDPESAALVSEYGERDDVSVAPDLGHILGTSLGQRSSKHKWALINVRESPPIDPAKLSALCRALLDALGELVFLAAEPGEKRYFDRFLSSLPADLQSRIRTLEPSNLEEVVEAIRDARLIVAERFHVNLICAHLSRPTLTIYYEDKVKRLMNDLCPGHLGITIAEIGAESGRRALSLPEPEWSERTTRACEDATEAFRFAVERGLMAAPPRWTKRLTAFAVFASILALTITRTPLVIGKRLLFGRGTIRSWQDLKRTRPLRF
jgi:polysaccharide pyruvyl transferase WcaK-like protein